MLTTKVRNRVGSDPADEGLSARHIREQVEASLRRLRTDVIDLYLAHEPDPAVPIEETLTAFDELIRAGKVRHAGLSNFSGAQLAEAGEVAAHARVPAVVNLQSGYSLLDRTAAADAFDVCARLGIGFTAYSPLAGGWLSGKYRSGEAFPAGSRMTLRPEPYEGWLNPATFAGIQALGWAAAERGIPLIRLALAWVLTDPGVCAAIVGPRRPQQLADAVAALDVMLTQQEREAIAALVPGS